MSRILINQYRQELERIIRYGGSRNEGAVRRAMGSLLNGYCKPRNFVLVEELTITSYLKNNIRLDGIVKDALRLDWGYWEAKDEKDSLDAEIEAKFKKGYPTDNILFEDTKTAVLIQNGDESLRIEMENDYDLDKLINQFLDYERTEIKDFRQAINTFSQDLPTILDTLRNLIDSQSPSSLTPDSQGNKTFIEARDKFLKVCQESINPDIKIADIREMIIQHILTEDIFTNIFSDAQFHQENNIAKQLNEVIKTFFTGSVKKNTFKTIQSYYNVIIRTASNIVNHQEKQKFLKVVYENFYKAYNPKEADRLGIVYTPNEIVKFMVQSTNYLLEKHFNKTLGDKGVEILDPCTGTGTFITEILDYLLTRDTEYKYKNEIHCNEVSILPYYIANLNIEYSYQQKTGEYLEFNNICLVDTLDHTNFGGKQFDLFSMSQENTERIKRQNESKISVIIGNPPYNANQKNENDNNKNRSYPDIDKRIKDTYVKESTAQKTKVYDMYSRFYRWASDRLNDEGIIAFITNSSFINAKGFDGFRKIVSQEFDFIYIIDLGGDIQAENYTGNVFNITLGIAIMFMIKTGNKDNKKTDNILIAFNNGDSIFQAIASNKIVDLHFTGDCVCLSLYRYENGERIDNITDWGLEQFRKYYQPNGVEKLSDNKEDNSDNNNLENNNILNKNKNFKHKNILHNNNLNNDCLEDEDNNKTNLTNKINKDKKENLKYNINKGKNIKNITIEKEDIFNYVYGVLHNPEYREKYELNLKREFPRIPFYNDFWQWSKWGKQLMELHLNYETIKPYKLTRIDIPLNNPEATPKPKLKADKTNHKIIIDEVTTLEKIPSEAWEYKLGNRSALEWILDQYKEKKPKDKTIAEKFNNYRFGDYKEQVIDLLMRVTTVSVETMKIINQMNK